MNRFRTLPEHIRSMGTLSFERRGLKQMCTLLLLLAPLCLAWMNPTRDRIAEGNRLFKNGKFDEAISKYGEVLVDHPDSPLLNFNMGDAHYKAGKYAEAAASFARVRVVTMIRSAPPKRPTISATHNTGSPPPPSPASPKTP